MFTWDWYFVVFICMRLLLVRCTCRCNMLRKQLSEWARGGRIRWNANNHLRFNPTFPILLSIVSLERVGFLPYHLCFTCFILKILSDFYFTANRFHLQQLTDCWRIFGPISRGFSWKNYIFPQFQELLVLVHIFPHTHVWPCSSSISCHLGNFFTELVTSLPPKHYFTHCKKCLLLGNVCFI